MRSTTCASRSLEFQESSTRCARRVSSPPPRSPATLLVGRSSYSQHTSDGSFRVSCAPRSRASSTGCDAYRVDAGETLIAIGNWDATHGRLMEPAARALLADALAQDSSGGRLTQAVVGKRLDRAIGPVRASRDYIRGLTRSLRAIAGQSRPQLEVVLEAFRLEAR